MDVAPEAKIAIIRRARQESIHPVVIHRFNEPIFLVEKRPEQIMLTNIIPTKLQRVAFLRALLSHLVSNQKLNQRKVLELNLAY